MTPEEFKKAREYKMSIPVVKKELKESTTKEFLYQLGNYTRAPSCETLYDNHYFSKKEYCKDTLEELCREYDVKFKAGDHGYYYVHFNQPYSGSKIRDAQKIPKLPEIKQNIPTADDIDPTQESMRFRRFKTSAAKKIIPCNDSNNPKVLPWIAIVLFILIGIGFFGLTQL